MIRQTMTRARRCVLLRIHSAPGGRRFALFAFLFSRGLDACYGSPCADGSNVWTGDDDGDTVPVVVRGHEGSNYR